MEQHTVFKTRPMQVVEAQRGEPLEVTIRRLYHEQGMTLADVAVELGVTVGTVSRWMTTLGITARFPGQRGTPQPVPEPA